MLVPKNEVEESTADQFWVLLNTHAHTEDLIAILQAHDIILDGVKRESCEITPTMISLTETRVEGRIQPIFRFDGRTQPVIGGKICLEEFDGWLDEEYESITFLRLTGRHLHAV